MSTRIFRAMQCVICHQRGGAAVKIISVSFGTKEEELLFRSSASWRLVLSDLFANQDEHFISLVSPMKLQVSRVDMTSDPASYIRGCRQPQTLKLHQMRW